MPHLRVVLEDFITPAFLPIAGIETNFANETNPNNQHDTLMNEDQQFGSKSIVSQIYGESFILICFRIFQIGYESLNLFQQIIVSYDFYFAMTVQMQ